LGYCPNRFLYYVYVVCPDVSEECTASVFKVTELVEVHTEILGWKKICQLYRRLEALHYSETVAHIEDERVLVCSSKM
jgi:hypothetical protein